MTENLWIKRLIDSNTLTNQLAVSEAKKGIQDYLASSFFAINAEKIIKLNHSKAVIFGQNEEAQRLTIAASENALVYGFQAHYLDLDDTHEQLRGHPSAVILSTLFAIAKPNDQGSAFIEAYIAGVEIATRLGRLFNPDIYNKGWHSTGFIGTFGAAAAIIKYLSLDEKEANNIFSLVASQASGYRFQFGSDGKPLQAGLAAKHAVEAAYWSARGIEGSNQYFFGKNSLFQMFDIDEQRAKNILEEPWDGDLSIHQPGLWFKAYPFCSAAFRLADGAKSIYGTTNFSLDDIDHVIVTFNPGRDAALVYKQPETGLQGKFSAEYITLLGLEKGTYQQDDFEDRPLSNQQKASLTKVKRQIVPIEKERLSSKVIVKLTNGQSYEQEIFDPLGSPGNPLSEEDHIEKLVASLDDQKLAKMIHQDIQNLDSNRLNSFFKNINGGNKWDHMQ